MVSEELFPDSQGPCRANLHNWGLARSPSCDCGLRQTMNHIVDTCPLTKFEVVLNLLHEADNYTVAWLELKISLRQAERCCQQNSVELVDYTYDGRRVVAGRR